MIRGFDASSCQGVLTAELLAACKAIGIRYVVLRCSVGNDSKDVDFDANVLAVKAAGLIPVAYHFLYPLTHIDPIKQAEAHFAACNELGSNEGDIPACIDLEWPPREERAKDGKTIIDTWAKWDCTRAQINAWTAAYIKRYHELQGRPCILYTYPYFAQCLAPLSTELGECVLWWASEFPGRVPTDADKPVNIVPGLWQKDLLPSGRGFLWQHDGNGGLKLPNGVDADFDVFVGSEAQFNALRALHEPEPVSVNVPVVDHLPPIGE